MSDGAYQFFLFCELVLKNQTHRGCLPINSQTLNANKRSKSRKSKVRGMVDGIVQKYQTHQKTNLLFKYALHFLRVEAVALTSKDTKSN